MKTTLKEELKAVADKANTATEFTNRLVQQMRKRAEEGWYFLEIEEIPADIREQVEKNLKNEFTDLRIFDASHLADTPKIISWEY